MQERPVWMYKIEKSNGCTAGSWPTPLPLCNMLLVTIE